MRSMMRHMLWMLLTALAWQVQSATIPARFYCAGFAIRGMNKRGNAFTPTYWHKFTAREGVINDEVVETESGYFTVLTREEWNNGLQASIPLPMYFDVPALGDRNGDLIDDFFDPTLPVDEIPTTGIIEIDDGMEVTLGTVRLSWLRFAGDTTGRVRIHVKVPDLAIDLALDHTWEIYTYDGHLTYSGPGETGTAAFSGKRKNVDETFWDLAGTVSVIRTNATSVGFTGGTFKNEAETEYEYAASALSEVGFVGVTGSGSFLGFFSFPSQSPIGNPVGDYGSFYLAFKDPNDANNNRVPDFSDRGDNQGGGGGDKTPPSLALSPGDNQYKLTIAGKPGQDVVVEQSAALGQPEWTPVQTIKLDANSGFVLVPRNETGSVFFRARLK